MKPPAKGTNKYRKIINRGCGGEWTYWPNGDDFDCETVFQLALSVVGKMHTVNQKIAQLVNRKYSNIYYLFCYWIFNRRRPLC
jgi:hypothetical protein